MIAFLKIFDIIPGWIYAAVIAFLLISTGATIGVLNAKVNNRDTKIAQLNLDIEKDRADRLQVAADYKEDVSKREKAHTYRQQEITDAYTSQLNKQNADHARELDRAKRVRDAGSAAAARDRDAATGDPAACKRVADRNAVLYDLGSEGFELVVESRKLLQQASNEVTFLKDLIANDRAKICGGAAANP